MRTRYLVVNPTDPETRRFSRRVGTEVKRVNDHGACANDPLRLLRFADGDQEVFWDEELKRLACKAARVS